MGVVSADPRRRLEPYKFQHAGAVLTFYAYDLAAAQAMFAAWRGMSVAGNVLTVGAQALS